MRKRRFSEVAKSTEQKPKTSKSGAWAEPVIKIWPVGFSAPSLRQADGSAVNRRILRGAPGETHRALGALLAHKVGGMQAEGNTVLGGM